MSTRIAAFLLLAVSTTTCATAATIAEPRRDAAQRSAAAQRALAHVRAHAAELGVTPADLDDVVVSSETVSEHSGVTHVYLLQRYRGIEIANAVLTVNIARDGTVLNAAGTVYRNIAASANRPEKTLAPDDAVGRAATLLDVTLTPAERRKIPATPVYYPVTPGSLRLAWQVEIETPDGQHDWVLTIDAVSGDLLDKFDRVVPTRHGDRVSAAGASE